jgi:outer membrane protein assembly factor BamB
MPTVRAQRMTTRWGRIPQVVALLAVVLACAGCGTLKTTVVPPPAASSATTSPADTVYMNGGALRASDGAVRWSADLGPKPPLIAGGVAYVETPVSDGASFHNMVAAVRLTDGATLWVSRLAANTSPGPAVLIGTGLLVVATLEYTAGLSENLRLMALRTSDGIIAWQSPPLAVVRRPTVDTPVPFVSPLAVASGRIAALADTGRDAAVALAWNAADGSQVWRAALPHASAFAGASASLTTSGGALIAAYAGTSGEVVGALDAARGMWSWSRDQFTLDVTSDGVVVVSFGDGVMGLRPHDGATLWTLQLGGGSTHAPSELAASDTTVFYGNFVSCPGATIGPGSDLQQVACRQVYAVRLADGKPLWQHRLAPNPIYNATDTVYGDGALYYQFFTGDRASGEHATLLALDATSGGQLWSRETGTLFQNVAAGAGAFYGVSLEQGGVCPVVVTAYSRRDGSRLWHLPYAPCPQSFIGDFRPFLWLAVG